MNFATGLLEMTLPFVEVRLMDQLILIVAIQLWLTRLVSNTPPPQLVEESRFPAQHIYIHRRDHDTVR